MTSLNPLSKHFFLFHATELFFHAFPSYQNAFQRRRIYYHQPTTALLSAESVTKYYENSTKSMF